MRRVVLVCLSWMVFATSTLASQADPLTDPLTNPLSEFSSQVLKGKSCFDICMSRVGAGPRLNSCQSKCQANREMRGGGAGRGGGGGRAGGGGSGAKYPPPLQECRADAQRFCSQYFGNRPAVLSCMRANSSKLSAACTAARANVRKRS